MPVIELHDTEPPGWLNYELHGNAAPTAERVVFITGFMTSMESLRQAMEDFSDDRRFRVSFHERLVVVASIVTHTIGTRARVPCADLLG